MLATALTLNSFAMYAVVIALVPLLIARGVSPTAAAWALGLGGAGQTLGRTLYATLASRTGVTTRTVALIMLGRATTAAFAMVPGPFPLPVGIAVALAPFAGAALVGPLGGYPGLFIALTLVSAVAALLALGSDPNRHS
jgi:hypothetical protein